MSYVEIRVVIYSLTKVLDTRVGRDATVQVKLNASTTTSTIRDFTSMNPSTFFVSKVDQDSKGFID